MFTTTTISSTFPSPTVSIVKEPTSLWHHIWGNRFYKRLTLLWLGSAVIFFTIFKQLYPFADFFSDSFRYIFAADLNLNVSIWPIGYSKFLRWIHHFNSADTALVAIQYALLQTAAFYFFLTITYWARLSQKYQLLLFCALFFNPLICYVSNYVNSDPLFWAISLGWLAQLIWIIGRPTYTGLIVHAVLLFMAFTVRNNAYYYPIISIIALGISRHALWAKISAIFLSVVPIVLFILFTRQEAYKITGSKQFSLFTGWQLANNAMYMYPYIDVDNKSLPTSETKALDRYTKAFYQDKVPAFGDTLLAYTGNYFIRQPESPLKQYFMHHHLPKSSYDAMVQWGKANTVFAGYGSQLIKQHPVAYLRHFAIPNAVNYFLPPLEKLEEYNLGSNTVPLAAQEWFDYTSPDVTAVSMTAQRWIVIPYQFLFMFLNFFVLGGVVWLALGKNKQLFSVMELRIMGLLMAFLVLNFGFTILATINVLRYQLFPMSVCIALLVILLPKMLTADKTKL